MRIIPHIPRGAVVGLLAGSSLMLGGGLGAAAITSLQPAGALSAQVPAVGVREQNVNSSGRVRVALPASQVPSNAKLPVNSAGRVQTQNGTGVPHQAGAGPWLNLSPGQSGTVANVTGSGVFTGLTAVALNYANGNDCWESVTIDGQLAFGRACSWGQWTNASGGALSGGVFIAGGGYVENFFPPGGFAFKKSLVVTIQDNSHVSGQFWSDAWYTTNG